MQVGSPGQEDPLKKEMATHSSILAWRIPSTEEPGGLQSTGSQSHTTEVTWHKIDIEWKSFLTIEVSTTQRFLSLSCQGVS